MNSFLLLCFAAIIPAPLALAVISRRRIDPLDPFLLMLIPFGLGTSLRLVYLAFAGESGAAGMLYGGADASIVLTGAMAAAAGTICMGVGALAARRSASGPQLRIELPRRSLPFHPSRLVIASLGSFGLFLAGWYVLSLFRDLPPLLSMLTIEGLAALAQTRVTQIGASLTGGTTFQFANVLFWAAEGTFFVALVCALRDRRPLRWLVPLLVLGGLVVAAGLINGSRTHSVRIVIVVWLFLLANGYRKLCWSTLPVALVGMVLLIGTLGIVRSADERTLAQLDRAEAAGSTFDTVLDGGHFVDVSRLGMIVTHVPERMDYLLGSSYTSLLVAWVPRVWWPEKPPIDDGVLVKRDIYGEPGSLGSYPAGLLGQAYMNFSYLGLLLIPFLAGFLIEKTYRRVRSTPEAGIVAMSCYLLVLWPMSVDLMQSSFSGVVTGVGIKLAICYAVARFVARDLRSTVLERPRIVGMRHAA